MTRTTALLAMFAACGWCLLAGAWEAGAFLGVAGSLTALLGPSDEARDAVRRNQAWRVR